MQKPRLPEDKHSTVKIRQLETPLNTEQIARYGPGYLNGGHEHWLHPSTRWVPDKLSAPS